MPNMARVSVLIGSYKMLTERKKELSFNSKKLQLMRDLFDIWSGHLLVNSRMTTYYTLLLEIFVVYQVLSVGNSASFVSL